MELTVTGMGGGGGGGGEGGRGAWRPPWQIVAILWYILNHCTFSQVALWPFFFEVLQIFWHQVCQNRASLYRVTWPFVKVRFFPPFCVQNKWQSDFFFAFKAVTFDSCCFVLHYLCPAWYILVSSVFFHHPVQHHVIPVILESLRCGVHAGIAGFRPRDVCVSAPTGSGKTLAYAIPVIQVYKLQTVSYQLGYHD